MRLLKIIFLVQLAFIFISCANKPASNKTKNLVAKHVESISNFSDSIYFSSIHNIVSNGNSLYMSDYRNNRILVCSDKLKFKNVIGKSGDGPGELRFPDKVFIDDSSMFIEGNGKITEFSLKGEYLNTLKIPKDDVHLNTRFVTNNKTFVVSNMNNKIVRFNKNGNILNELENEYDAGYVPKHLLPRIRSHIFQTNDNKIIKASSFEPVIELYNDKLKILDRITYDTLEFMQTRWQRLGDFYKEPSNKDKMMQLVPDAFVTDTDNRLYLLLVDTILVFELDEGQIKFDKQIVFDKDKESDYFMSLAVKDGVLYLFNHVRGTIEKYKLN